MDPTVEYYNNRAASMDTGYTANPSGWVLEMITNLQDALRGRHVLEVACGTGYWTHYAAQAAAHVTAVDAAPAMLDVATAKGLPADRVTFCRGDAYALQDVPGDFDGAFSMQWFSHVPHSDHSGFLNGVHSRIGDGGVVFMADNQAWDGMVDRPYAKPGEQDTFETRILPGHPPYEIVKNYFMEDELRDILEPHVSDLNVHMGTYWWWSTYRVGA